MTKLDEKHHLEGETIVKTGNGVEIDLDYEPVILFRGRDKLALPLLKIYSIMCQANGCTQYQLDTLDEMILKFSAFNRISPTMKQPGCTEGR